MNQTLETILTRRSTRKFLRKPIPEEEMELIVQAALHAPSAKGLQTWQFTVVRNREKIQKLATAIREVLDRKGYNMYEPEALVIPSNLKESPYGRGDFRYGAPALVLVTNRKDHAMAPQDAACAMENMFLAAHSLGIGSVWINQLQDVCDVPAIRQVLDELGIPADHVVYGMAALGYPDDVKADKARTGKVVYAD